MDKNLEGTQDESGSSCSSGTRDLFGDPEISPRIGDEYQVEIPPLMTKDELLQLMEDPIHFGLPIPVVWVRDECESINKKPTNTDAAIDTCGPIDPESTEDSYIIVNNEDVNGKVKNLGPVLDNGEEIAGDDMEIDLVCPQEKAGSLLEGCLPVPGLSGEAWVEIECDSFLLGLYIFGKNLSLVKQFVGSKGMGEILSYYHGKFYKSSEYNRWLECRKKRKKRVPYGEKIFTSWRQQELMSRLSSHVSEECKTRLIEASRIFGEGKMLLKEFVFSLRDMVGPKVLVHAVAIGKGKRDLMSLSMDPAKTNLPFTTRPGIPSGKSVSSLTVDEIVKFLTGDIRLSKARANDLFWDAVWPRLLDNGWRVETPRNYISLSSKQSWVYLIPGVKKFSRRKLVKGTHYFDSVTDVLNKVAAEPKLLELEPNSAKLSISKDEEGSGPQAEQGADGFSARERHSYLQPRFFQEQMKFTIVDTSLVCRNGTAKVIELRTLPTVSGGIEQNTIKKCRNVVQENDIANGTEDVKENKQSVDTPSCEASMVLNNRSSNGSDRMVSETDKHEEDQKQQRMPMKFKFVRKVKSSQPNDVGPTTNKPALTPCDNRERSSNAENNATQAETFRKPSSVSSFESSPVEKNEETWMDLNLPHTPQESNRVQHAGPLNPPQDSDGVQQAEVLNPSGIVNGQRQSRRNRPLTAKALEAFACGYLSPKKKRKSGEAAIPKPSRRVRAKTALLTSCGVSIEDEAPVLHKMEKGVDGVFNGSSNMVSTSQK